MIGVSTDGVRFITAWEGYVSHPYNDSQGNATIGVGHLLHFGPVTSRDKLLYAHGFGELAAMAQLHNDLGEIAIDPLRKSLRVALTQPQVDALCSIAFNCGAGSIRSGGAIMTAVNGKPRRWSRKQMGQWHDRVRDSIMLWAHPRELQRRRLSEARLFSEGAYKKPHNPYANA